VAVFGREPQCQSSNCGNLRFRRLSGYHLAGFISSDRARFRAGTAVAYAHPVRRRGNLELLSDTLVARIVIEANRARGVEIVKNGLRETIWAEREIILCGGTVNSPQVLMLSGIGPDFGSKLTLLTSSTPTTTLGG
jgi:hypothetical protein